MKKAKKVQPPKLTKIEKDMLREALYMFWDDIIFTVGTEEHEKTMSSLKRKLGVRF